MTNTTNHIRGQAPGGSDHLAAGGIDRIDLTNWHATTNGVAAADSEVML
jgi:hypothetical protein